ncbi:uncharacterized protein PV06_09198 [Exophiala oligosperma]|uniref:GH16 domain-containing protein n=2 Tax=Chaetothyriales TaxID=34395 RepID=A0A0D2D8I6_9EURO|nr:uncharacterized protein PV06_09198 [Exophiala oligosperma]KAJ9639143.1 hypothetical protein H2204_004051 [Knufia peltigerae]KIW39428.1 hypothetical protein PV06_09198 [Exophiala oligosperma]
MSASNEDPFRDPTPTDSAQSSTTEFATRPGSLRSVESGQDQEKNINGQSETRPESETGTSIERAESLLQEVTSRTIGVAVPYPSHPSDATRNAGHKHGPSLASYSYPLTSNHKASDPSVSREPDSSKPSSVTRGLVHKLKVFKFWGRQEGPERAQDNANVKRSSSAEGILEAREKENNQDYSRSGESDKSPAKDVDFGIICHPLQKTRSSVDPQLPEANPVIRVEEKHSVRPGVYFRSRRVKAKDRDVSWLRKKKDPRQKWLSIVPVGGLFLGLCVAAINVWVGYRNVPVHKYCLIYEDDFSSQHLNKSIWLQEVQVGGFGNGQFDETTGDEENVYIQDHMLHITPTLQDEYLMTHNVSLNLFDRGTCTTTGWDNCVSVTNTTNGTVINPVKSGRINTSPGANIRFGRIEVVAKLPEGDWLWPGIWLFPTNSDYGVWPASGEIDMAESRGNNWTYPLSGNNVISSTLHWGPNMANDGWWRTYKKERALHSTFSEEFHTFGLEWTDEYMYTYLDSRLLQVLYQRFSRSFWDFGGFSTLSLGTPGNIWANGTKAAPFDRDFFLILDVAVGGTNGWFRDGLADKPWENSSPFARKQFWDSRDQWYPTWQNKNGPSMQVKSVKIWQQQGYNGCGADATIIG